ncbi:MAG: hypothetical protein EOO75_00255 [Myxococcales bacterium]|nr:MAG: hypothetical protein EOO75_00255 [Myxococcales bacterium]
MTPPATPPQTMTARVLVHRPRGPRWLPAAVGLGVGAATVAATSGQGPFELAVWALAAYPALQGVRRLLPRSTGWVEAEIEVSPGQLRVLGPVERTLRARDVRALSTAGHGRGAVVAVGARGEASPWLIELPRAEQAAAVCGALAVGARGLGALRWPLRRTRGDTPRLGALGLVLSSLALPLAHASPEPAPLVLALMALMASVVLTMVSEVRAREQAALVLTPQGVDLSATGIGWAMVPYDCIEEVRFDGGLELRLTPPHPTITLRPEQCGQIDPVELAHIAEQIHTASQRARGLGPDAPDTAQRLGTLHRGAESTREWLQRLDAQASTLSAGAYRGEGYGVADLWQALDDHDAPADVRLGAARVLLRVQPDEARRRVALLADEQRERGARHAFLQLADDHELDDLARHLDRCALWRDDDRRRPRHR